MVFDGGLDIHPHCNQNTSSIAYRFSDFPTYFETNGFGNLINNNDAVINFKVKNLEVFVIEWNHLIYVVNMRKELENIYIRIIYFKVYDDSIMK